MIIGGGVGGTSLAYHLAKPAGRRRLLERLAAHLGSTFHSAAWSASSAAGSRDEDGDAPVELYRRLKDESEFDPGWTECRGSRLASSEERLEELRRQAGWAKSFGLPLELISAEEAKEMFPLMSTEGVLGAAWLPTDGYVDPSQLTSPSPTAPVRAAADLHLDPGDRIDVRDGRLRRPHRARRDRGRGGADAAGCSRRRLRGWRGCGCR